MQQIVLSVLCYCRLASIPFKLSLCLESNTRAVKLLLCNMHGSSIFLLKENRIHLFQKRCILTAELPLHFSVNRSYKHF